MERNKNKKEISPVARLHATYISIIMFLIAGFSVAIFTMKTPQQMANGIPNEDSSATGQMPPGGGMSGGMPPFVKQMVEGFKTKLEKNPNDLEALIGLANMYYDSSQFDKAIPLYEKAIKVNGGDNNVKADLGTSYFYTDKNEQAIALFKEVLAKDPKHLNARYNLGVVYKTIGDLKKAKEEWNNMMPYIDSEEDKKKLQEVIDSIDKSTS